MFSTVLKGIFNFSAIFILSANAFNLAQSNNLLFGKSFLKNIVGNGENTGDHHFLLFQQCFKTF